MSLLIVRHKASLSLLYAFLEAGKVVSILSKTYFEILDQKFYHQKSNNENNNSVCVLFTQLNNHYLFTGDLEKEGETSLIEYNPTLPHVQLFKAGHHGSDTANNDVLLSKITPEVVCISCCAGGKKFNFPKEEEIGF